MTSHSSPTAADGGAASVALTNLWAHCARLASSRAIAPRPAWARIDSVSVLISSASTADHLVLCKLASGAKVTKEMAERGKIIVCVFTSPENHAAVDEQLRTRGRSTLYPRELLPHIDSFLLLRRETPEGDRPKHAWNGAAEDDSAANGDDAANSQRVGHLCIVMGVSASGKSTIASAVADELKSRLVASGAADRSVEFVDADVHHPASNVAKMARGEPLDDSDRAGWLVTLADVTREITDRGDTCVLGCSALKRSYRRILFGQARTMEEALVQDEAAVSAAPSRFSSVVSFFSAAGPAISQSQSLVYLCGSPALLLERIQSRAGHFAKPNLLDSQLATLEEPTQDECRAMGVQLLRVDLDQKRTVPEVSRDVADWLESGTSPAARELLFTVLSIVALVAIALLSFVEDPSSLLPSHLAAWTSSLCNASRLCHSPLLLEGARWIGQVDLHTLLVRALSSAFSFIFTALVLLRACFHDRLRSSSLWRLYGPAERSGLLFTYTVLIAVRLWTTMHGRPRPSDLLDIESQQALVGVGVLAAAKVLCFSGVFSSTDAASSKGWRLTTLLSTVLLTALGVVSQYRWSLVGFDSFTSKARSVFAPPSIGQMWQTTTTMVGLALAAQILNRRAEALRKRAPASKWLRLINLAVVLAQALLVQQTI